MNEKKWVSLVLDRLKSHIQAQDKSLIIEQGIKLPYSYEIVNYRFSEPPKHRVMKYETDLLISDRITDDIWKPRVVIEAKIKSVSTHDAITYSQKAATHKTVHPYLRYGIMLGARKHYSLPGRLYRHGANFDFMISFQSYEPTSEEWSAFISLIKKEIQYSRKLEEIIFQSRLPNRKHYTVLQKALILK